MTLRESVERLTAKAKEIPPWKLGTIVFADADNEAERVPAEVECSFCDAKTRLTSQWVEIEARTATGGMSIFSAMACQSCATRVKWLLIKETQR